MSKIYILTISKGTTSGPGDHAQRMDLCRWITAHPELLSIFLFTDEASFTRDGIKNSRNVHTWPEKFEILTAITHLLITKYILKLAGICGSCNVNICT